MGILDLLLATPGGRRAQMLPATMDRNSLRFFKKLEELGRFLRDVEYERWPNKRSKDADEKSLGEWLSAQRQARLENKWGWSALRASAFDRLHPEWHNAWILSWDTELKSLVAFLEASGYKVWPSRVKSAPASERRIASWLSAQRRAREKGMLTPYQHSALSNVHHRWYDPWVLPFEARCRDLKEFLDRTGRERWPTSKAEDADERSLGSWLVTQRKAKKGVGPHAWSDERDDMLRAIHSDWTEPWVLIFERRCRELSDFLSAVSFEYWPNQHSNDTAEAALGSWLTFQRGEKKWEERRAWEPRREELLQSVHPMWSDARPPCDTLQVDSGAV